jgi:hypothetical protein
VVVADRCRCDVVVDRRRPVSLHLTRGIRLTTDVAPGCRWRQTCPARRLIRKAAVGAPGRQRSSGMPGSVLPHLRSRTCGSLLLLPARTCEELWPR